MNSQALRVLFYKQPSIKDVILQTAKHYKCCFTNSQAIRVLFYEQPSIKGVILQTAKH